MKSKTKQYVDENKIKTIFLNAGLGGVTSIFTLDEGEFNTAYSVSADSGE